MNVVSVNTFPNLDAGETEALNLAFDRSADFILLDDLAARMTAKSVGLTPVGTLGILQKAADQGFLLFDEALERLHKTKFRMSVEL